MLQKSRCIFSEVLAILFCVFLLTCCIISTAYGQVNNDLDEPFILRNGEPYKDKLTIASSKAVTEFAKLYQHRQDFRAKHAKRQSKASTKADRGSKPAFTTFGIGYDEQSEAAQFDRRFPGIEFRDSRSLKVLPKVKRERARADREERRLRRPEPRYIRFPDIRPAPKRRHRRPKPGLFRSRTPRPKPPVRQPTKSLFDSPKSLFDIGRVKPLRRQTLANAIARARPVNPFKSRGLRPKSSVRQPRPTPLNTIQQKPRRKPTFILNAVTRPGPAIPFQTRTLKPKPPIRQPPPAAFSNIQREPIRQPIPISNTIVRPRPTSPFRSPTSRPKPPIRQSRPTHLNTIYPKPLRRPVIVSNTILQQPTLLFSRNYYETGQNFVQPYRNSPIAVPATRFASHSGIDLSISPTLFPVNYGFAIRHY